MLKLFITGFVQVFLVSTSTWFIAHGVTAGAVVASYFISYFWTHNVKRISVGTELESHVYASGAAAGNLSGMGLLMYFGV